MLFTSALSLCEENFPFSAGNFFWDSGQAWPGQAQTLGLQAYFGDCFSGLFLGLNWVLDLVIVVWVRAKFYEAGLRNYFRCLKMGNGPFGHLQGSMVTAGDLLTGSNRDRWSDHDL